MSDFTRRYRYLGVVACAATTLAIVALDRAPAQQPAPKQAPAATPAIAAPKDKEGLEAVLHGAPHDPSPDWTLAAGGRIYDNWWEATGRKKPEGSNPNYPAAGQAKGANTFRCKECHGWDYRGRNGDYAKGEHATGIKGITGARNRPVAAIVRSLRSAPHSYTPDMLTDDEIARVARFVSQGQHDMTRHVAKNGTVRGSIPRGKAIFQTTCATCHGYDGRLLNWGKPNAPEYVGTAAEENPSEMLHKIRNGHPGQAMINLRSFPLKDAVDVLAYTKTLPTK